VKHIVIIDYGLGNLRSVQKAFEHAGARVSISSNPSEITNADALILPGVGAFCDGIKNLNQIKNTLYDAVNNGTPLLGICLGMQLLLSESEEDGHHHGLDLIPGRVVRFPPTRKIPHMGWNNLNIKKHTPLLEGIPNQSYVYFVHSYYVDTKPEHTIATSEYSVEFAAIIQKNNIIATQFHPEKSGKVGLQMIRNFLEMC
jgi:glutamine amidotransferase